MSSTKDTVTEGYEVIRYGDRLSVELWYPRSGENKVRSVLVGLCDVRAADCIDISYDFARDGWAIKQASNWTGKEGDTEIDYDYQEVAFVRAWARDPRNDEDDDE